MRLPWVSRLAYDERGREIERLRDALEREHGRVEQLIDSVLHMKMSGAATMLRPAGVPAERLKLPVSAIQQAIDEDPRAIASIPYRNYLSTWAQKEMKKRPSDVDEEEWIDHIVESIRELGESSHDDDDDDDAPFAGARE